MDKAGEIGINKLQTSEDAEICARMMSSSEPYMTLRRGYEASLKLISDPMREVYVARSGSELVGFIIVVMKGALIGYIQSICVVAEWRGKGVGSELMDFAEKRVLFEVPNVFLMVSSFNNGARRLYKRRGYKVVGELKDFIVSGYSEIILRKTIGPTADFVKG
ncbi:MAG: GNAT family N-acetyltransferase [Candidatus Bathyarchaeota archaeon]|nr:GNAT family N-acetyltransferase [Candidatus Bathyarchaeota archaeon]